MTPTPGDAYAPGMGKLFGGVVLIVLLLAGIGSVFGGGSDAEDESASDGTSSNTGKPKETKAPKVDNGDEIGAQVICRDFVKKQLKSPSSAEFSAEAARQIKGPFWVVAGSVDADNSFGASVRSNYVCKVRYAGDDKWRLRSLTGLDF